MFLGGETSDTGSQERVQQRVGHVPRLASVAEPVVAPPNQPDAFLRPTYTAPPHFRPPTLALCIFSEHDARHSLHGTTTAHPQVCVLSSDAWCHLPDMGACQLYHMH